MINKLIKYILAGLSNTIFSYLIYLILLYFFNYLISYIISIFLSSIYIYKLNTKFVFNIKSKSKFKYLFYLIYLIQILSSIILLRYWINVLYISKFFAPLVNIIIISPIAFLISSYLDNFIKNLSD